VITAISKRKNKIRTLLLYFSPLLIIVIVFSSFIVFYDLKEFGNVVLCTYTENLKDAKIILSCDLNKTSVKKPIYQAKTYTNKSAKQFIVNLLNKLEMNSKNIDIKDYGSEIYFFGSAGGSINLLNGTYSLYGGYDNDNKSCEVVDKNSALSYLDKIDIFIPSEAIFKLENEEYVWNVDKIVKDNAIIDGYVSIISSDKGKSISILNYLATYNKVRDVELISEIDAYNEILKGKFNIHTENSKIKTLEIKGVKVDYLLDTKGFFQPIYVFNCNVNGDDKVIQISAIK